MKQENFLVENISRQRHRQRHSQKKNNGSENNTKSRQMGMHVIKKLHKGDNSCGEIANRIGGNLCYLYIWQKIILQIFKEIKEKTLPKRNKISYPLNTLTSKINA